MKSNNSMQIYLVFKYREKFNPDVLVDLWSQLNKNKYSYSDLNHIRNNCYHVSIVKKNESLFEVP